ncbi:class I SAM-dependent methyltransferase [Nocardia bhagyanarayanae]|uniref:Methyltransferase family protein n=1 Tax=Nocardia bhagyanarayanae TaxID=1215925 RepID=A0A543FA57_9NOCA|nr:class I SAM-dependent methyltransferase [Nocardia bhagyanarayanae]TQM30711.1 methyltransferase family protein [Nocardia bhagyanarayanae]
MSEQLDHAFWENRYRTTTTAHVQPNPHLTVEAAKLPPGRALDAGCGEGAEAVWLAAHGWRVTAVDFATTALDRARERADIRGPEVADRIDWRTEDLTEWIPPENSFDLVCSHYAHPATGAETLLRRLAPAVATGGTLLIVGHHPSDAHSAAHASGVHATAEGLAAELDPVRWEILVAENRSRTVTHGSHQIELRDAVLVARKNR